MRILYWCPANDEPMGGVKVIYRHSELLNRMGIDSEIFHPQNIGFACSWFRHNVRLKSDSVIHESTDFNVVPEIWAQVPGKSIRDLGGRYGIFVQNAVYVLNDVGRFPVAAVRDSYRAAELIITISAHVTEFVQFAFPELDPAKILQVTPSVSGFFAGEKAKLIAYMPRKLPEDAQYIANFSALRLPHPWRLVEIANQTEDEVKKTLSESSIFISLSQKEGIGLPPIEAALSGNLVVGYTGQGGREYFKPPVFMAVEQGDVLGMMKSLLDAIAMVERGWLDSPEFRNNVTRLSMQFSAENELASLRRLAGALGIRPD